MEDNNEMVSPGPQMPGHYFPINAEDKYEGDPPYYLTQYQLIYREMIYGEVYRITHEPLDEKYPDVLHTLQKDLIENTIAEFDIDVVVVATGGKYGLRKQRAYVLNAPYGPQPFEFERFYPWSPQEFRDIVPKMRSTINPDTPIFGIELVPIIDGNIEYSERWLVESGKL